MITICLPSISPSLLRQEFLDVLFLLRLTSRNSCNMKTDVFRNEHGFDCSKWISEFSKFLSTLLPACKVSVLSKES